MAQDQQSFAAQNMSYNTPDGKPPDHRQILIDLIASQHGPQAGMLADSAFKNQDKQVKEAMIDHGMTAEEVLGAKGIDVVGLGKQANDMVGGLNSNPKMLPAKSMNGAASVTPEGDIQEGGGLSWIGGRNTGTLLKKLLVLSDVKKNSQKSAMGEIAAAQAEEKKQNALDIADAYENGSQLADFKSLYGLAGPVKAELSRRGVDVAKLQLQATAETILAQTLNGPQQVRLKQSIGSVMEGLDELDNLNSEFQRSGIKAFNKGQIEFLANGGGTPAQQELAQRFKTQIIGLQDEFGNVVMGGNSPTDRALELAGKIFNSDFNNTAIAAATKQMRRLLGMRKSAIENIGSATTGIQSQDTSKPAAANAPAANGGGSYQNYLQSISGK